MAEEDEKPAEKKATANGAQVPMLIVLRKAVIDGDGELVKELKFREPTADDICAIGTNPVLIDMLGGDTPKISFEAKAMTAHDGAAGGGAADDHQADASSGLEYGGLVAGKFFHAGSLIEDLILDCYRLAKYYGRNPDEFLKLPLSEVQRHMAWTGRLVEIQRANEGPDDG